MRVKFYFKQKMNAKTFGDQKKNSDYVITVNEVWKVVGLSPRDTMTHMPIRCCPLGMKEGGGEAKCFCPRTILFLTPNIILNWDIKSFFLNQGKKLLKCIFDQARSNKSKIKQNKPKLSKQLFNINCTDWWILYLSQLSGGSLFFF